MLPSQKGLLTLGQSEMVLSPLRYGDQPTMGFSQLFPKLAASYRSKDLKRILQILSFFIDDLGESALPKSSRHGLLPIYIPTDGNLSPSSTKVLNLMSTVPRQCKRKRVFIMTINKRHFPV